MPKKNDGVTLFVRKSSTAQYVGEDVVADETFRKFTSANPDDVDFDELSQFHSDMATRKKSVDVDFQRRDKSEKKEVKRIMTIAWPLMLNQFGQYALILVDMAFAGYMSLTAMAAAGLSGIWFNIGMSPLKGTGLATTTLVSQAFGAGKYKLVGTYLQLGIVFEIIIMPLVMLFMMTSGQLLVGLNLIACPGTIADVASVGNGVGVDHATVGNGWAGKSIEYDGQWRTISKVEAGVVHFNGVYGECAEAMVVSDFTTFLAFAMPFRALHLITRKYMEGQKVLHVGPIVVLVAIPLNAALNALFVNAVDWGSDNIIGVCNDKVTSGHIDTILRQDLCDAAGHTWVSDLQYRGLALATMLSYAVQCVAYIGISVFWKKYHKATWQGFSCAELTLHRFKEVMSQSVPRMIEDMVENWFIAAVGFMSLSAGRPVISAHQTMINLFICIASATAGVGNAVGVRVGILLGGGHWEKARAAGFASVMLGFMFGCGTAAIITCSDDLFGRIFSNQPVVWEQFALNRSQFALTLMVVSIVQINVMVLQAQGRAGFVAKAFILSAWFIGVPASYIFGVVMEGRIHNFKHVNGTEEEMIYCEQMGLPWGSKECNSTKSKGFLISNSMEVRIIGLWEGLGLAYIIYAMITSWAIVGTDWYACMVDAQRRAEVKQKVEAARRGDVDAILLNDAGHTTGTDYKMLDEDSVYDGDGAETAAGGPKRL